MNTLSITVAVCALNLKARILMYMQRMCSPYSYKPHVAELTNNVHCVHVNSSTCIQALRFFQGKISQDLSGNRIHLTCGSSIVTQGCSIREAYLMYM